MEGRLAELERLVQSKDEELELAARLGQALVRKETKQTELLSQQMAKNKDLEEEVKRLSEIVSAGNDDVQVELERLRVEVKRLEDLNFRLQYDIKRKDMQLDLVKSQALENAASTDLAALATQHQETIERMTTEHAGELEVIREEHARKLQEQLAAAAEASEKQVEELKEQLEQAKEQDQANVQKLRALEQTFRQAAATSTASFSSKHGNDKSCMSFASRFSTETLELDLDLGFDGDDSFPIEPTMEETIVEERSASPVEAHVAITELPPAIPLRPVLKTSLSFQEMVPQTGQQAPKCAPPAAAQTEESKQAPPKTSEEPSQEREASRLADTSLQSSGLLSPITKSPKHRKKKQAIKGFVGESWKNAIKGSLFFQEQQGGSLKAKGKTAKWNNRFCVFVDGLLFVFRSESDAQKYSAQFDVNNHPAKVVSKRMSSRSVMGTPIVPLHTLNIDRCEVRMVRRPQDAADPNDARSSMLAWLKRRTPSDSLDSEVANAGSRSKSAAFRLHIVERNSNDDANTSRDANSLRSFDSSTMSFMSFGSDSDESSYLAGNKSGSGSTGTSSYYMAFREFGERNQWARAFTSETSAFQLDAGSLWIRKRRNKKNADEWVKRYAVVTASKLELYAYGTDVVCETVSLTGVKVEPAYTAHLFISHKKQNKTLITLRAYDGTERNWWIKALRVSTTQWEARKGQAADPGSPHALPSTTSSA